MKKILVPIVAIACGLLIGTIWHFAATTAQDESFVPYKVGEQVDQLVKQNIDQTKFAAVEVSNGEVHDAAEIEINRAYDHEFIMRNHGKGLLRLQLVEASRSCQLPLFEDQDLVTIDPGKSMPITFRWTARDASQTDFEAIAKFATNDPNLPEISIKIRGQLEPATANLPVSKSFPELQQDQSETFYFDAVSFREDAFTLKDPLYSDDLFAPFFKISQDKLDESALAEHRNSKGQVAKSGYRVTVDLAAQLPVGFFEQEMVFPTDLENESSFYFRVSGNVAGNILVSCQSTHEFDEKKALLRLHDIAPGEPASEAKLSLSFLDGAKVPAKIHLMADKSIPQNMFEASFEPPVEKSSQLTVVPFSITTNPNAQRVNLVGPGTHRLGRIVVADETDNIVAVIYINVLYQGVK